MNQFQTTQNIVSALNQTNFVWPGSSPASPILGRVAVTDRTPTFNTLDQVSPCVLIRPDRGAGHGEHPADVEDGVRWTLTLYVLNATDQAGGAAVVGGNRQSQTVSMGRGLLEIEPLLRSAILQAFIGTSVRPRIVAGPAVVEEAEAGVLTARAYEVFAGRFPVQPTYGNVTRLLCSSAGALTWTPPVARWDLVNIQVNRASGSTPPPTPGSGSVLTSSLSPTATGYNDSGGGTGNAYSVFALYDQTIDPFTGKRSPSTPVTNYSGYYLAGSPVSFVYVPASIAV
jgi:hypothetical protein